MALHILKLVAERGDVSLKEAVGLARNRFRDHRDQYPLALLLEDGYLGMTINHEPPPGGTAMREFSLAITFHMSTLPTNPDGKVRYLEIESFGSRNAENEKVFLKAKGALYLDEQRQKFWDRLWSFLVGFTAGLFATVAAAYVKHGLRLQ